MNKIFYILIAVLFVATTACTKDPLKDLEGNDWKKERNVVSVLFEGQIGTALIERNGDDAQIRVFAKSNNISDLSKVEIKAIDFSYGASSLSMTGSTLDFTSADATAIITVKSGSGETLDWTVSLKSFNSDLEGTWSIGEIGMYSDMFSSEDWGWESTALINDYLPELNPELDDVITFIVEGADESGNPYGSYSHAAGADGAYGEFIDTEKGWDFNSRLRKVPTGDGTWLRDYSRNKVVITDKNMVVYELDLELLPETGELSLKSPLPYMPENFSWEDTDYAYEELANMSNPMWYKLKK